MYFKPRCRNGSRARISQFRTARNWLHDATNMQPASPQKQRTKTNDKNKSRVTPALIGDYIEFSLFIPRKVWFGLDNLLCNHIGTACHHISALSTCCFELGSMLRR